VRSLHDEAAQASRFDVHVDEARAEADLAAEAFDAGAHLLDHAHQAKGADVRLGDVGDLGRRAGLDELVEYLACEVARVTDLAPELAVGKGAGAAFAELHVRLRIEDAAPPEPPGVFRSFAHRLAALEHEWPKAHLRQAEAGEKAAGAEADDDGPWCRAPAHRAGDEAVGHVGCRPQMRIARM